MLQYRWRRSFYLLPIMLLLISHFGILTNPSPVANAQTNTLFRVYLTFEDGPTDAYTPQILDILASHNAKATFFVNGYQIPGHEYLLQRIIHEGHALGNHLWIETDHYAGYPDQDIRASYFQTEEAIRAALGPELPLYDAQVKLFRWPGGGGKPFPASDGEQIITYNWNVSGNDCGSNINFESDLSFDEQVVRNVLRNPNPSNMPYFNVYDYGDGVVVILHDINRVTGRVLPAMLEELQKAGATFEALPRSWDSVGTMPIALGTPPIPGNGVPGTTIAAYTLGTIRIRVAPSLDAATLIGRIPPDTQLMAIGRTGGWYQVVYQGQTGWAYGGYLLVLGPIPSLPLITPS